MSLNDLIRSTGTLIANTDHFAETVIYRPYNGRPRSIGALIERNPVRQQQAGFGGLSFDVLIANDATLGVTAVQERQDRISIPPRIGETELREFRIVRIIDQDPGMWTLECHG